MQAGQWLLLTDYASKYRISVSTLRRRIKGGQIQYRFEGGKYFILDAPPQALENSAVYSETLTFPGIRPKSGETVPDEIDAEATLRELRDAHRKASQTHEHSAPTPPSEVNDETTISSATKLLTELKRAYMSILHEKEEQIIQLKEEVSDLKTLVRVLEEDNDRMRRYLSHVPRP